MPGSHGNSIEIGQSEQELVSSKNANRLKKRLCIALVVLAVVGLCIAGVVYYGAFKPQTNNGKIGKPISLSDVLDNKYYARHSNASWISDNLLLYRDAGGNVVTFDVATNKTTILADGNIQAITQSFSQSISPDHRFLLLGRDYQKIFRHSALAHYDILDLQTKQITKLADGDLLALAEWGPVDNSILFIKDNNIYYQSSVIGEAIPITNDGSVNIFNGICDWVYEEEVFATKTAAWISPDNKKLAYVQFDDSPVNHVTIPVYGVPGSPRDQYPGFIDFPYPKTGSHNPTVKLFLVDLPSTSSKDIKQVQINAPEELLKQQHIISVVAWANNNTLLTTWMNRVQNNAIIEACEGQTCRQVLNLTSKTGWMDFFKAPTFNKNGSHFIYLAPQPQKGTNDSYHHLTLVSVVTGKQTALTSGEYAVLEVLHWNDDTNTVYYSANNKNTPYVKHLWSVQVINSQASNWQCLTCNISRSGVVQTYFNAEFSSDGKYAIISNDGPSLPRTDIVQLSAHNASELVFLQNWEGNHRLHASLANVSLPTIKYHQIPLDNGFDAIVKLQLPPNMDTSGKTKYPMLVDVYAGPGSYAGLDKFEISFSSYLVTSRKYILAQINGRGSGNRGENLLHSIYRAMGTVEIEDQIETARKLTNLLPFIDEKNVAIWGWSYGGFAAGMSLAQDNSHVFKCAASVAPVTDWTYYDTIYTERYMGLPDSSDNLDGYETARLSTRYEDFKNKTYLLVHGSMDDNVHYQQSMALSRSLEVNDIAFEQITYPDEDHSLWGVRRHLYHALDKFFAKCLTNNSKSSSTSK